MDVCRRLKTMFRDKLGTVLKPLSRVAAQYLLCGIMASQEVLPHGSSMVEKSPSIKRIDLRSIFPPHTRNLAAVFQR